MLVMHVHTLENFNEREGVQSIHLSNRIQVFLFNLHKLGNKERHNHNLNCTLQDYRLISL